MCREYLFYFGYATFPEQGENPVGFFSYEDATADEKATFNGYQELNRTAKEWYAANKTTVDEKELEMYTPGEGIYTKFVDEPLNRFKEIRTKMQIERK
mmetsp:Transcript_39609/g.29246  ORF Transcript_39609/g.29246 Transcript_39609/m.29246 type:complete len:98 (-) Transcript_39609:24-317(-)